MVDRIKEFAEQANVAIYRTNAYGLCTYANRALCELFELPLQDILGVGWMRAVHSDDQVRVRDWIFGRKMLDKGDRQHLTLEYRLRVGSGSVRVAATSCELLDAAGDFAGWTGIITRL